MFEFLNALTIIFFYVVSLFVSCHVLLHKEDPRAALGWVAVVIGVPILGILLYLMFGQNRVATIAKQWEHSGFWDIDQDLSAVSEMKNQQESEISSVEYFIQHMTQIPLVRNIQIEMLVDGDAAYPSMLEAIASAEQSLYLSSYIFSTRGIGHQFINALVEASSRGVEVRVLIDGVGGLYSFPTAYRLLKCKKIQIASFLPPFRGWYHILHLNLRNHRKLLIVDNRIAFTGGMNIHRRYLRKTGYATPRVRDIHFKIEGDSLKAFTSVFAKDWFFATGESLKPQAIKKACVHSGTASLRVIPSGPHQSQETLALLFKGIFTTARHSICIMTPYFILDPTLMVLMQLAVLRGVHVEVILPEKNNLFFMKAACESLLASLLRFGVKVYYRPGSFAHSKLLIVDRSTALLGSANWDARSFYLNFELTIQVLDQALLDKLLVHFETIRAESRLLTILDLQSQPIVIKLRNAFFRLFSPYL